jgi:hypothetical protein
MTRNLDAGTDFGLLFGSNLDFLTATAATWEQIQQSNIPERMAGIAAEIVSAERDVASLQEATLYRTGPVRFDGVLAAQNVAYNELGSLMSALAADGARYTVVNSLAGFDAEAADLALGQDVRITDYDAMLVRSNEPPSLNFVDTRRGPLLQHHRIRPHTLRLPPRPTRLDLSRHHDPWAHRPGDQHPFADSQQPNRRRGGDRPANQLLSKAVNPTTSPVIAAADFNTGPGVSSTRHPRGPRRSLHRHLDPNQPRRRGQHLAAATRRPRRSVHAERADRPGPRTRRYLLDRHAGREHDG